MLVDDRSRPVEDGCSDSALGWRPNGTIPCGRNAKNARNGRRVLDRREESNERGISIRARSRHRARDRIQMRTRAGRRPSTVPIAVQAPRPLLPRVVAPLEGRSSGSRISRSLHAFPDLRSTLSTFPSESSLRQSFPMRRRNLAVVIKRSSGTMCRSSPVTATGSRRNFTGFPQVREPFSSRVPRVLHAESISGSDPVRKEIYVSSQSLDRKSLDSQPKEHPPPSVDHSELAQRSASTQLNSAFLCAARRKMRCFQRACTDVRGDSRILNQFRAFADENAQVAWSLRLVRTAHRNCGVEPKADRAMTASEDQASKESM